jgi:hypothetical protein
MTPDQMLAVHRRHRTAEDAHDFPALMQTLTADCFLEQVSLGLRSDSRLRGVVRGVPGPRPDPRRDRVGDDVLVAYGQLHGTMKEPWLGPAPTGREFTVPLVNIVPFKDDLMHGERILFDAAMFAERIGLDVHKL